MHIFSKDCYNPFENSSLNMKCSVYQVKDEGIDWGWGVVVNFSYKSVPTVRLFEN